MAKQARGVYTKHFDCDVILHQSGPRTRREADDGLSSSVSAISVSFMFCGTRLRTRNKPLEEQDKTFLPPSGNRRDARPNFLIARRGWGEWGWGGKRSKKIKPRINACAESFPSADITVKCVYKST